MVNVYIQGNCQAPAMAKLLREACPAWRVDALEVYLVDLEQGRQLVLDKIATADIAIVQPIVDEYRGVDWLSTKYLKANVRPDCRVIVFPSIYTPGLYPELKTIRSGQGRLRLGNIEVHNILLAHFIADGVEPAAAVARVLDAKIYTPNFVEAILERNWKDLRRREVAAGADVRVSDIIRWDACKRRLMHYHNHPTRSLLSQVAGRVLRALGYRERISEEGADHLDYLQVPVLPSIAHHLGWSAELYRRDFRFGAVCLSQEAYLHQIAQTYAGLAPGILSQHLAGEPAAVSFIAEWTHACG